MKKTLTHFDRKGDARMVDVSAKEETEREAVAKGSVLMKRATLDLVRKGKAKKGDVLNVARLAGIMGAKRTSELIPLAHPLALNSVKLELRCDKNRNAVDITATCKITGRTGVEMEALTAVAVAALAIYDMLKAVDRGMKISEIRLVHKSGGKSGSFEAPYYSRGNYPPPIPSPSRGGVLVKYSNWQTFGTNLIQAGLGVFSAGP